MDDVQIKTLKEIKKAKNSKDLSVYLNAKPSIERKKAIRQEQEQIKRISDKEDPQKYYEYKNK